MIYVTVTSQVFSWIYKNSFVNVCHKLHIRKFVENDSHTMCVYYVVE